MQNNKNLTTELKKEEKTQLFLDYIIEGIQDVKGKNICVIDLRKNIDAVADYYVVCEGNVPVQTRAISQSITSLLRDEMSEKPWHAEGQNNGEWILLDYVNVVVHIFIPESRSHYAIEDLWSDGEIQYIENIS